MRSLQPIPMIITLAAIEAMVAVAWAQPSLVVEEVIVTARRREESLQSVPVAVTALDSANLERQQVFDLADLDLAVPNLTVIPTITATAGAQVYIRGIGQDEAGWTGESGVGVYLDGVALSRPLGAMFDVLEFERIEVLRGPQGTLYGRNTTSGAIKYVSKRPSFDGFSGKGEITIGSFHRADIKGSVNSEIEDDVLAVRIDASHRSDDGYVDNILVNNQINFTEDTNKTNRQFGKISTLWRASDNAEVLLIVDGSRVRDDATTPTPIRPNGRGGFENFFVSNFLVKEGLPNINKFDSYGINLQPTWQIGDHTLQSITAYRNWEHTVSNDADGDTRVFVDLARFYDDKTVSQEFQLGGPLFDKATYVAGLYYFHNDIFTDASNFFLGAAFGGNLRNINQQDTENYAAYFDVTYALSERFNASAGGRYTKDKKDGKHKAFNAAGGLLYDVTSAASWGDFTPRFGLDFQATDDVMIYASWGKGFKGGANANFGAPNALRATTYVAPEEAETWEGGFKSDLFDQRVRLNFAAFHTNYTNLQSSIFNQATGLSTIVVADTRIWGTEAELTVRPTQDLTFYGTFGQLDTKYTDVQPGHPAFAFRDTAALKHSPELHFKIGGEWGRDLANAGRVSISSFVTWTDEIFHNVANTAAIKTEEYAKWDVQVAYEAADGRWRVGLAGNNLTDEEYILTGVGSLARFYAPGRTWSMTAQYRF